MSITLIVLLAEVVLVFIGLTGFLFYLRWKREKIKTAEFESLLTNFDVQVGERKVQLIHFLEENYAMETKDAEESANFMIEAEKNFLQQFLTQQIEKKPVTDFHQNLCELLDQYLYFVPSLKTENEKTNIVQAQDDVVNEALDDDVELVETNENPVDEENTAESNKTDSENSIDSDKTEISEDIQNLSDDISIKSETVNEIVQKDIDPKQTESTASVEPEIVAEESIVESNESEAEPDWGDAFAESGDEADETTEAAYEAEKNKS